MSLKHTIKPTLYLKKLLVICFTLLVYACSTQTAKEIGRDNMVTVDQLIRQFQQVEKQASPQKNQQLLTIAANLAEQGEYSWADTVIQQIDSSLLGDSEYIDYSLLASDIFIRQQKLFEAKALLTSPRLKQLWDRQDVEDQQILRLRRANLFSQLGNLDASINERVILSTILPPGQQEVENQEIIWQNLTSLSKEQLSLSANTTTAVLQGWYQLAVIHQQYQDDLDTQHRAINEWMANNPNHPASYQLPKELQLLQQLINQRPQKITLLLPMQGKLAKAGRAIRDGFFAAYYDAFKNDQEMPVVSVLDTSSAAIDVLYDQAIANGTELIIGPLSKDRVATLQLRQHLPVVTLALNYLEESTLARDPSESPEQSILESLIPKPLNKDPLALPTADAPMIAGDSKQTKDSAQRYVKGKFQADNLFQFGLSLDGEAVQAAERAWLEGHRIALIMTPDTNWSARTAQAFIEKWQALGGKVVNYSEFNDKSSYSTIVKSALNIDKSQQRARALKRLFGRSFEFEPRRRADMDMIFLVANTQQARQIKPTLAFYYAGDIQVYSTSQVFSSAHESLNSNDLNGIRFTTLPWLIDDNIPAKKSIQDNLTVSDAYARLYAMGADTFLLYPRLQQLQQIANVTLHGATGQLQLTHNNRIVRKHPWAEFYKGQARLLPAITTDRK